MNVPAACRFIFDDRGQAAARLRIPHCHTARDCELAVPSRWVCFSPHAMFPGSKLADGFRWFCSWAYQVAKRGPGKKVLFVDELWQWVDVRSIPDELQDVVRTGRADELDLFTMTQRPSDYHKDLRSQVTEWVCFQTLEPADLDAVRPYYSKVDQVRELPKGSFIAYNRESGAELKGKLW
jgi:hypothetical protein